MVTKQYIALLDIKAIIRKWQDLDVSDAQALKDIEAILRQLGK
jgi:polyhydroxyalkanoate synthesis regulator protein